MAAAGGDGAESLVGLVVEVYGDAGHGAGCFMMGSPSTSRVIWP